ALGRALTTRLQVLGWLASRRVGEGISRPLGPKLSPRLFLVRDLQGFPYTSVVFPGAETGILYVNLFIRPDAGFEVDLRPPALGAFCDQRKEFLG
ncbi:MAG: hypothetical protein ACRDKV_02265, partial [Solirubrobacterales bacterium]